MLLRFTVASAVLVLLLGTAGEAQTPPATSAPVAPAPAKTDPNKSPAKTVAKKPAAKAKTGTKQPASVETGPCRLGVISAIGDRFSVHKFGITIFETEDDEVPVEGWGLDDLAVARVRAATGNDPSVRRINYPKGTFEAFYHPKSLFLREPNEDLQQIVRSVTPNANCERYMVIIRFKGTVAGTKMQINGVGVYSQGIGSLARHSHLFANVGVMMLDGGTYERINSSPSLAAIGDSFSRAFQLQEDPLTKLDHSFFPDPPASASTSAVLRERTRALVSAHLDRAIPRRLQE
jgi:hypothetical protein